jgi:hypothetical protein
VKKWVVKVNSELYSLLPEFLSNRWEDHKTLAKSLNSNDFEKIRKIGHLLQGTPGCFGYSYLVDLGKKIEDSATKKERDLLAEFIANYETFLLTHKVVAKEAKEPKHGTSSKNTSSR